MHKIILMCYTNYHNKLNCITYIGGLSMRKTRVAINGFGRIGRMVFRQAITDDQLEVIAVNASYPPETLAHLIKYDSVHGILDRKSTRLNSSHVAISYAVFCLKKEEIFSSIR